MSRRRRLAILGVVVLLGAAAGPSTVRSGSADSPEVPDECGDAAVGPAELVPRDATDVEHLRYEYAPSDDEIRQKLGLCASGPVADQERFGERLGWIVRWVDDRDRDWSLRVWLDGQPSPSFSYRICLDGSETIHDGGGDREGTTVTLAIPNDLPETGFETALNGTYVEAGRYPAPSLQDFAPWNSCGTPLGAIHDRAPDDGTGASFRLEEPGQEPETSEVDVRLSSPTPERTVVAGEPARFGLALNNTSDEVRNVTLDVDADLPPGSQRGFTFEEVTLLSGQVRWSNLTVRVPRDADGSTRPLTVVGAVRDETLERIGWSNLSLDLTVRERTHRPVLMVSTHASAAAPGETVVHELSIRNDGNGDDTIELSVAGERTDWTRLEPDRATLPTQRTRTVALEVTAPEEVEPGWYGHTVTATSQGDRAQTTTVEVVTAVSIDAAGGPLLAGGDAPALPFPGVPALAAVLVVGALVVRARRG